MKSFLKITLFVLFAFSILNGNEFRDIKKISLNKDEIKKIIIKYDGYEKLFKFRWTLYKNGGLVIFRSYDQIVAQNILYLRDKNQSFRVELKPRGADFYNVPYLLVKFTKFDYEKNKAIFKLFLSDEREQIRLKYLKNE
jgi:hypothetical protein